MNLPLRSISPTQARRLAVTKQQLSGSRATADSTGMLGVMHDLGCLQLDPISAVARSHLLVMWSRLGPYNTADLDSLIYESRHLFEYWAHAASIVLTEDYSIHSLMMRRYRNDESEWLNVVRGWMDGSKALYNQILQRLEAEGPLPSRSIEDNASSGWYSTGWTNGRNVSRMLDFMWMRGDIMVAERSGLQKLWDLSERCLPEWAPREELTQHEVVYRSAQKSLLALGVARAADIKLHYTRYRYPDLEKVIKQLQDDGCIEQVRIIDGSEEWPGPWYVHSEDIPTLERLDNGWQPRTTLLSPFDNLICDRARTEKLFGFNFRIEIYVPKEQRKFGYYVLPILHGDRLIGRIDPTMNRKKKQLEINAVYAEPDAPLTPEVGVAIRSSIEELAAFLGAREITFTERVPEGWKNASQ